MTTANLAAPGAAPTNPSGNSNPNAVPGTAPNEPNLIPLDQVEALLEKQRNGYEARLRRLEAKITQPTTSNQPEPTPEPAPVRQSAADKQIREELEKLKKERAAERERFKADTVWKIGAELGVPATDLEDFSVVFTHHASKGGTKVHYNDENGQVEMLDADGQSSSLKDAVQKFLKGSRGSRYIAAPSTGGVPRGSNAPASSGEQDPMKMTPEQRKAWRKNAFQ